MKTSRSEERVDRSPLDFAARYDISLGSEPARHGAVRSPPRRPRPTRLSRKPSNSSKSFEWQAHASCAARSASSEPCQNGREYGTGNVQGDLAGNSANALLAKPRQISRLGWPGSRSQPRSAAERAP